MSSITTINERFPLSVTKKSAKGDLTQAATTTTTTKKKKCTVVAAVILSTMGFTSIDVAHYNTSSSVDNGDGDNRGGGGIQASVDTVEGLLCSVPNVC